jgi:hypothetical protein
MFDLLLWQQSKGMLLAKQLLQLSYEQFHKISGISQAEGYLSVPQNFKGAPLL